MPSPVSSEFYFGERSPARTIPTGHDPSCLSKRECSRNFLSGPLATELGQLLQLEYLYLQKNKFSGARTFHARSQQDATRRVFRFQNSIELSLSHVGCLGPLPTELGNLANLRKMQLYNNEFEGALEFFPCDRSPHDPSQTRPVVSLFLTECRPTPGRATADAVRSPLTAGGAEPPA